MTVTRKAILHAAAAAALLGAFGCAKSTPVESYDVLIRGGTVYDGSGAPGLKADVALKGDRIARIGELSGASATKVIDATGKAVAPGFINMLGQSMETLIEDGRGESDLVQGVTLEVFGEGWSMGPLTDAMKAEAVKEQSDIRYDVKWTSLGEYLDYMTARGVSPNLASFVGATTVRIHEVGYDDRPPTAEELSRMQDLVRAAMREGALGVGSSLIYAPAFYAKTDELVALTRAAAEFGGGYISHIRSEGDRYLEALDEFIAICRDANTWGQVYHIKPAGQANWSKSAAGLARLDAARAAGLDVAANMYTYTAGATGFDASMPPWVQEGGHDKWMARLRDPAVRKRVVAEMRAPAKGWENLLQLAGGPENVLLLSFKQEKLKPLTGKTLAEVAKLRGTSPEDTIIDLVVEDDTRVGVAYFLMSEDNVKRNIAWPHTMFGSDEGAYSPEGVFLKSAAHPRAYGNVARLLGKYVRDEKVIPLEEAIRRLTEMPATQLRLRERGALKEGYFADVVVFDPATVQDHATYADSHKLATGVSEVFVNGALTVEGGKHTGVKAGRVVRGPGWTGWTKAE